MKETSKYYEIFLDEPIDESIADDLHPCVFLSIQFSNSWILARCTFLEQLIQKSVEDELLEKTDVKYANYESRSIWMQDSCFVACYETSFFILEKQMKQMGLDSPSNMAIYKIKEGKEVFYYITGENIQKKLTAQYKHCEKMCIKAIEEYNDNIEMIKKIEWKRNS